MGSKCLPSLEIVMRKITVDDLNAPLETPSAQNFSRIVAKRVNAALKTIPGFSVAPFVSDMGGARVIRIAPNGDIFLSRSQNGVPGRVASSGLAVQPGTGTGVLRYQRTRFAERRHSTARSECLSRAREARGPLSSPISLEAAAPKRAFSCEPPP
jgi:hypothetical protein